MKAYEKMTAISYQSFRKIRSISKLMMFAGTVNTILMVIGMATYRSEVIDPTTIEWICALSDAQFTLAIIMMMVGIIGMVMFASMNHGSDIKKCYKLWCKEHGYAPYNACKH